MTLKHFHEWKVTVQTSVHSSYLFSLKNVAIVFFIFVTENTIPDATKNEIMLPQVVIKKAYSSRQQLSEDNDSKR